LAEKIPSLRENVVIAGLTRNLCARTLLCECGQVLNQVQDDSMHLGR
jgi:hypothetical protein